MESKVDKVFTSEYIYSSDNHKNTIKITDSSLILHYLEYQNHETLFKHIEYIQNFISNIFIN